MSRQVLVLGAGGFVGQHVLRTLAATSDLVPVAAWHRTPLAADAPGRRVQVDACDETALAGVLATVDGVVNCVAGSPDTITRNGRALFAAAGRQAPALRIVQLSSMAVYGSQTGVITERAALRGDVSDYARAKVAVEEAAAGSGNTVLLRPGCIYGPGSDQWSVRIANLLRAHRIGDLGAGGDGFSNLVFIDDVVAAICAALRAPGVGGQAYNLAASPPVRWNEYFMAYAKALGAVPLSRISRRRLQVEGKLLAAGLKVASLIAGRLRLSSGWIPDPVPPSLVRLWRQEIRLDSSRAERELGITWTPLSRGLAATATWLRTAGTRGGE